MKRFAVVAALALVASVLVGTPVQAAPQPGPAVQLGLPGVPAHRHSSYADRSREQGTTTARPAHAVGGSHSPVASPESVAVDPGTQTIYVPSSADSTVKVIDARSCNALRLHCRAPVAAMPGRGSPIGIAVDPATHTVYVVDVETGVVLVFDGAHCNARTQTACASAPVALPVGDEPIGLALNPRTHTAYVGHVQDSIAVFDTATCNAARPAGCTGTLASISAGPGPALPTVDPATDTLYAPDNGPETEEESGTTVSVIDIAHCRSGSTSGCDAKPFTATVGQGPTVAVVDPAADTVYVSNQAENTISVLPRSTCNARDHRGCPTATPTSLRTGLNPQQMAVDRVTRTLYVQVQDADVIQAVDTRACNAHHTAGCAARSRASQTAGQPFWLTFDQRTRTVYTVDHADNVLSAYDARACSAVNRRGCRREVPTFAGTGNGAVIDPPRHTLYEPGPDGVLNLTDTDRCRVGRAGACPAAITRVTVGGDLADKAVDPATHTLYVEDFAGQKIDVIDTATCNVVRHDRCQPLASVDVPGTELGFVGLNAQTHTLYITQFDAQSVAVLRGAHCNATDLSGCGSTLQVAPAGPNAQSVVVDDSTNTVYVTNSFDANDTVTLLPGAACDAGTADCRPVAQTHVGRSPIAPAVDARSHTLFVPNFGDEVPGTVSLVDTATCNAGHTAGCTTTWPQIPAPRGLFSARVVPSTRTLFTANIFDSTVSVIDIRHCNSTDQSGCPTRPRRIAVGYGPVVSVPSPRSNTLYVTDFADATQSLVDLRDPCRHHLCFR